MPKKTDIRREKKVMLTDRELVAKYEKGAQPVDKIIGALLSKPNPNAPAKTAKR